jgi:uncharacterized protein
MKEGFFARKTALGVPNALILLMLVFFFVPFAGRGARMALQKTENNVKDWLPDDFRETEELAWFAKRFVSEQFIVATWNGCNSQDQRLKLFVSKLHKDQIQTPDGDTSSEFYRAKRLGAEYALFADETFSTNWGGKNEKWLVDERGKAYYITPDGRLYRWEGNPNVVSIAWRALAKATGAFHLDGQFVAAFGDPGTETNANPFWADPRLLTAPLFKSIETGPDLVDQLAGANGPLATPSQPIAGKRDAISRLTGTLFGPPVPAGFSWSSNDLTSVLPKETVEQLPRGWEETWDSLVDRTLQKDFGGDMAALQGSDPNRQAKLWHEFFDAIGIEEPQRQTCVVITLTEPARRNLQRVIGRGMMGKPKGRVFQIAEECGVATPARPTTAPPPFSWLAAAPVMVEPVIHIGGPPVDNVAIDEEGTITLVRLIGYSIALGLGLSLLCLGSIRLMMMVFFVGGVSAMASMSMVWWCNASVDAILLTMPSLVYVLGMSGAIHIVNYYRDAVILNEKNPAGIAVRHAIVPCTLAAITTAIGLLSLCSSNILPIRKFGIFSAMGVMTTLALLYIYLPSALTVFPPTNKTLKGSATSASNRLVQFWEVLGGFILRRHWWVNAVAISALILLGLGLFKIKTSVQLLKLFDSQAQIIRDYRWLEENFGRLVPMELVVRFPQSLQRPLSTGEEQPSSGSNRELRAQLSLLERAEAVARVQNVLQQKFGYEGQDIVGHGMSAITFLRGMPEASRGFDPQRLAYNRLLQQSRPELLKTDYLAVEPKGPAEGTELWRVSLRLGALNDVDYGQFVSSLRAAVEPVVASYHCRQLILNEILSQHSDVDERVRGDVLILGRSNPTPSKTDGGAQPTAPGDRATELDDVRIFSESLAQCLQNDIIRQTYWHDPAQFPLDAGKATSEKWAEFLKKFACVILVQPHADYDMDFIRQNNPHFVDASQKLADVRMEAHTPRVATGKSVEMSLNEGEMDIVYTGVVPIVYKAQRTLLESLIQSVFWAFVLIGFVMTCLLSPARTFTSAFHPTNIVQAFLAGAISMIPNVFPVVVIFGIMGHANILVDIGSMMTASVAMGIAVDDTIHFLTWFRDGLRSGLSRRDAIFKAYKNCAPAMTQTTIIGGIGLSVFAMSTFTPTQRFGTLMLALLAAALVGDLIFLPALLASPLGRFFSVRPRQGESASRGAHPHNGHPGNDWTLTPETSHAIDLDVALAADDEYRLVEPEPPVDPPNSTIVKPPQMLRRDGQHIRRRS